jgi:hypothetical protein
MAAIHRAGPSSSQRMRWHCLACRSGDLGTSLSSATPLAGNIVRSDNELPGAAARQRRHRAVRSRTAFAYYRFVARRARRCAFLAGRRAGLFFARFTRRTDFFTADDERAAFDLLRRGDLRAVLCFLCFLLRIETSPRSYTRRTDSGLEVNKSFVGQVFFKSRTKIKASPTCLRVANAGNWRDENGGYFIITTRVRQPGHAPGRGVPRAPSRHSKTSAGRALLALATGGEPCAEIPRRQHANTCFTPLSVIL